MLHGHLVCRINDGKIQWRLLTEKELTLKLTWEIIQAMESAEKFAKDLQQDDAARPVHAIRSQHQKMEKTCYRCKGKHKATACPFKEAECHACKKKGHMAKVCRSRLPKPSQKQTMPPK